MRPLLFLSIIWLVTSQALAIYGPELKTSSPGFHRRKSPKVTHDVGYKLPGNARPLMYEVTLTLTPYSYQADGEVIITLDVDPSQTVNKTYSLQLNSAVDLDSETAATFTWNGTMSCQLSEFGSAYFEINCPEPIEGENQILKITYTTNMASVDEYGMYTFYYTENNAPQYMIATQLEQDYARRLFPCFDEPEYKAPIKLTLKTDTSTYDFSHWISNTKVASESKDGTVVTTTFETTPNMSAYLLAFVVTPDFKNFSDPNLKANYEFEIFARPSAENYLSIALEHGPKLIDLMGNFTGITYTSLGNNRMVFAAIPEFTAGAMENWGLITFREQILIDEGATSTTARDKQEVVQVIAHELAHQWFGDYVTLDWWSETWLNEGFATYFEYYLTSQISTDYDMVRQFVVKEKQQALKTDGYPDAIPLSNNASEVTSDTDLWAEFGDISYIKGASVIKILHQTLGDDAFKKGLQTYLQNNKYGNPTAKILIDTLRTVVPDGQNIDLSTLFKEWIYESGYPLLDVSLDEKNTVTLQATKFSSSLDKTGENNTANWWIPLTYTTSENPGFDKISFEWTHTSNLSNFSVNLPKSDNSWIIFNLQSIGYYRVNYDQTLWNRIITVLNNSKTFTTIDVLNRAQLIDDIFNVAKSYQPTDEKGTLYYLTAFKLAEYLQYETEYHPWYTFFTEMQYLMEIIQDEDTLAALEEKILNLISAHVEIPRSTDNLTHTEILKRNLILTWACKLGHENCIQWAKQQFENYKNNTSSIDNNYRDVIVCTGLTLTNSSSKDFKTILSIMEKSILPFEQTDLVKALTCINKDWLVNELLLETVDYNPTQAKFSRMYNDKIISTLYTSGFDKIKYALNFVLTYDNGISQYWQEIETPETLMKMIASKIYNQKHIDMFNEYITKNEGSAGYTDRVKAAKEAIEIANENIKYLNKYSAVLKSVIVYNGEDPPTTTSTNAPTPTPGSSNKISYNILMATIFAFLLKHLVY